MNIDFNFTFYELDELEERIEGRNKKLTKNIAIDHIPVVGDAIVSTGTKRARLKW